MMKVYKNYPEVVDALAENDMVDNAVLVTVVVFQMKKL